LIIVPLKGWKNSYIWENRNKLKKSVQEEIKNRWKARNACYHSVQNLLSFSLLSKKIKIHKTIILSIVLHGCETWYITLKEEGRLRVFENRVVRKIFGPRGRVENTTL
jgi:hypothetical protein